MSTFGGAATGRADGLFPLVYDLLRQYGHRPSLHVVRDDDAPGHRRAWLSAAGFGALGHSIEHAARLYVQAGTSLASDPELRAELRRDRPDDHRLNGCDSGRRSG